MWNDSRVPAGTALRGLRERRQALDRIIALIRRQPAIEGVFLGGSLATEKSDELSDIDLGIATRNRPGDLDKAFSLRHRLAAEVGHPLHYLERTWEHSKMAAFLFGRSQFPPIGFELDIFFSQLQYVYEQMPGATFGVVYDRHGRLGEQFERLSVAARVGEIRAELKEQIDAFPFDTNHAAKAQVRGDLFNFQFVVERMRAATFSAAASREEELIRGSKRASGFLTACERQVVQRSYHEFSHETIRELAELYLVILTQVQHKYGLEQEVEHLRSTLPEVS